MIGARSRAPECHSSVRFSVSVMSWSNRQSCPAAVHRASGALSDRRTVRHPTRVDRRGRATMARWTRTTSGGRTWISWSSRATRSSRGRRWCPRTIRPRCSPAAGCSRCCRTCWVPSIRRGGGSRTARPACGCRTSKTSATTGTPRSSRCSATGASATTSRTTRSARCGNSSPSGSGWIRTGSTCRASSGTRTTTSRETPSPQGSGPNCSPRPACRPIRSTSAARPTVPGSAARAPASRSTARRTGGAAAATPSPCRSASPVARTPRCSTCSPMSTTTRHSGRTATRTATAAATSRSATPCSWSTGAPQPVSNRYRAATSTSAAVSRGSPPPRWTPTTCSGSTCSGRSSTNSRNFPVGPTRRTRSRCG